MEEYSIVDINQSEVIEKLSKIKIDEEEVKRKIKNSEDEIQESININPDNKIEILFLVSTPPKENGKDRLSYSGI